MQKVWMMVLAFVFSVDFLIAGPGESGFAFLKIGVGGQAAGMGEAVVAHANDATAVFWNPALIALSSGRSVTFTYNRWIEGLTHNAVAYRWPAGGQTLAVYALYTGVDGIEQRDIPSEEPTGTFSSHNLALGASYARRISERLALGLTAKYIYERIFIYSTQAVAMDFGLWYHVRYMDDHPDFNNRWRVGMTLSNIGVSGKMIREKITLPATIRLGTAFDVIRDPERKNTFTLSADVIQPMNDQFKLALGSEFVYNDFAAVRLGYQIGYDSRSFTAGLGFRVWNRLSVDYGFMPMSNALGSTHRVTTGFHF